MYFKLISFRQRIVYFTSLIHQSLGIILAAGIKASVYKYLIHQALGRKPDVCESQTQPISNTLQKYFENLPTITWAELLIFY
jgi:hypothetical protein